MFTLPAFPALAKMIAAPGPAEVERALQTDNPGLSGLAALLAPAARSYLPALAAKAEELTSRRFGRVVQLYAPVYLSNLCTNSCAYCGFSASNRIKRRLLSLDEAEAEMEILYRRGFNHILLVSGEAPHLLGVGYLEQLALRLRGKFAALSIEVQPLLEAEYARLFRAGITSVAVYQETYDREVYKQIHLAGQKTDYDFRLATPARAAAAGMREVGIGALLGMADWRLEGLALGLHLAWLRKNYWRTGLTVSFPRLRPAVGGFAPLTTVTESDLAQLIFALRIFDPDVGLLLSTREEARFRDGMLGLGPTRYSAGSCTAPGGYADPSLPGEQFAVDDSRSLLEVCAAIEAAGFDPVRKDWDAVFQEG